MEKFVAIAILCGMKNWSLQLDREKKQKHVFPQKFLLTVGI